MNEVDQQIMENCLQAVADGILDVEMALARIKLVVAEVEADAYQRGRDYSMDFNSL